MESLKSIEQRSARTWSQHLFLVHVQQLDFEATTQKIAIISISEKIRNSLEKGSNLKWEKKKITKSVAVSWQILHCWSSCSIAGRNKKWKPNSWNILWRSPWCAKGENHAVRLLGGWCIQAIHSRQKGDTHWLRICPKKRGKYEMVRETTAHIHMLETAAYRNVPLSCLMWFSLEMKE